ncbi:YkgJ family cysteine cluster protein [Methanofollis fontis]|nr:YkgJ family cysteine cluster protein [Methanofollis fontis]
MAEKDILPEDEIHLMREEPFSCTLCGRCCMTFGKYIKIDRQTGPQDYLCTETVTGTSFSVRVEDRFLPLFRRPSPQWTHPSACPFLRQGGEGFICTVHGSRPPVCRSYTCCGMRVMREGAVVGELRGRRDLKTGDAGLRAIWDEQIRRLDLPDPEWRRRVSDILEIEGFETAWYV